MGIPEHDKLVKLSNRIRSNRREGMWIRIRKARWKNPNDPLKRKARILQIIKIECGHQNREVPKNCGFQTYRMFMMAVVGPHYRRYGKYGD